jgi:hypothetical protein
MDLPRRAMDLPDRRVGLPERGFMMEDLIARRRIDAGAGRGEATGRTATRLNACGCNQVERL